MPDDSGLTDAEYFAPHSVPDFSRVLSHRDIVASRMEGKPTPEMPLNWPPGSWETGHFPADDSPEAVLQWFNFGEHVLEDVKGSPLFKKKSNADFGHYVRDAFRLVNYNRRQGWSSASLEPDVKHYGPHDALIQLRAVRDALETWFQHGKEQSHGPKQAKKPKRSTEQGEARVKLIAALTEHHQYSNGSCLNWNSVGNNELARLAEVGKPTASEFLKKQFGGHSTYKTFCQNETNLVTALKMLNDELTPRILFNPLPDEHADAESDDDDGDK